MKAKNKTHTARDMYEKFDEDIPYWMFKEVLSRYNKKASDAVIQGDILHLGSRLGYSKIQKLYRNFKRPTPNWGESKKARAKLIEEGKTPKGPENPDGEEWIVYYTDSWFLRWGWIKSNGRAQVKNQRVYEFVPTANRSNKGDLDIDKLGNKGKLTLANKRNPLLHLKYEQNEL